MDRLVRRNVLALSGRAVEASGDVDVLLLDKTGTITLGNRQAAEFIPMPGVSEARAGRGRAAGLAGRRDARGPLDRRAGQAVRHPRARARPARRRVRPVHRADADERRRLRRHAAAQGRRRRDHALGRRRGRPGAARAAAARSTASPARAATPLAVARDTQVLGVDRAQGHRSRRACASASSSCARWASAPSWSPATTASPRPRSPRSRASTTSWPRRRPRPSSS